MGAYDRWEMKLSKNVAPLLKEWGDMVLFANYKTIVVNVDGQGAEKGKNKAQGGKRVMYTTHTPSWDAKNRHNLKEELKLEFSEIAAHITTTSLPSKNTTDPHQQKRSKGRIVCEGGRNRVCRSPGDPRPRNNSCSGARAAQSSS